MPTPTRQQLAAEITNDPKSLGYAPLVLGGDRLGIANKLNSTYAGVGIIWRTDLIAADILASLVATEVQAWTTTQWVALQTLLIPGKIDASKTTIRNLFSTLLGSATASLANVTAVAKSPISSRAEELWGYGTRITENDIAAAIG